MATQPTLGRRVSSFSLVIALVASLLAIAAPTAQASAPGWARLTSGVTVTPGDAKPYGIRVESRETTINLVAINVPNYIGLDVATLAAPEGWTGKIQDIGGMERLIFSGGSIPEGGTADFGFGVNVAPPADATERSAAFDVQLSSDSGRSFETAMVGSSNPFAGGTLTTTIKFLEVIDVQLVSPTVAGAADGTGTEGQTVWVQTTTQNFASIPVVVDPGLTFSGGADYPPKDKLITDPDTLDIAGNGTSTAVFEVELGAAEKIENRNRPNQQTVRADRPVNFVGTAAEKLSGSTALPGRLAYEVQRRAEIILDGDTFQPTVVAPGPREFAADAGRTGTPDVTINGGSISFADTVAQLQTGTSMAAGSNPQTLTFAGQVAGSDGDHQVSALFDLTDSNGFDYLWANNPVQATDIFGQKVPLEVTIDAIAPTITADISLPNDGDGRPQEAAKDGDSITVSGTIDDTSATIDRVRLVANGVTIAETDTVNRSLDKTSYSVTFDGVNFGLNLGTFSAIANATDPAGNVGLGVSGTFDFDNVVPFLESARTLGTLDASQGLDGLNGTSAGEILVHFFDNATVKGGCNPNEYTVDGQSIVREVQYSDGTPCFPGEAGPDNDRILVLSVPIDRDSNPSITYTPINGDRLKDGAGNFAPQDTVTAVSGILPPMPDLVDVYRNTSGTTTPEECLDGACEDAYNDEGMYWTRFAGDDTVVCVSGARPGYQIQVVDGSDNPLTVAQPTSGSPDCIHVPIDTAETAYDRGIRFVNSAGAGESLQLTIALDQTLPGFAEVVRNADDQVEVTFNEKLVEGDNYAVDWLVYEQLATGGQIFYSPDSVRTPEVVQPGTNGATVPDYTRRTLTVDWRNWGDWAGVGYEFTSGDYGGTQYGDRAGNKLPNTGGAVPPTAQ